MRLVWCEEGNVTYPGHFLQVSFRGGGREWAAGTEGGRAARTGRVLRIRNIQDLQTQPQR